MTYCDKSIPRPFCTDGDCEACKKGRIAEVRDGKDILTYTKKEMEDYRARFLEVTEKHIERIAKINATYFNTKHRLLSELLVLLAFSAGLVIGTFLK